MSLQRYINQEDLLNPNSPRYAQLLLDGDVDLLQPTTMVPVERDLFGSGELRSELHVYTFYGDYLTGNHNNKLIGLDANTRSLLLDVRGVFAQSRITKGSYVIVHNLFKNVWGGFDAERLFVKEISPDRTECQFTVDEEYLDEFQQFQTFLGGISLAGDLNTLAINFGFNRIGNVVNVRFDGNSFFVKFYQPLDDEITEKTWAWVDLEMLDPYVDSIILSTPIESPNVNRIGAPNFDIDVSGYSSNSTAYKSWDDILSGNALVNQRIIEQSLSGSISTKLNIDYTDFTNFVFYSSAEKRVKNLKYKISKIEDYSGSIAILNATSASNTIFISSSVSTNQRRIDQITSTFTSFENWAYYSTTGSLFTHDISGSNTPVPKRIYNSNWVNYSVSSSQFINWYSNLEASASQFDQYNNNRLYWSIPEHIIMDNGNSNFIDFVDMVGEHFDELHAFIRALPKIHEKEEHPARGVSTELLPHIAKSFGWELQNTKQLADLWLYKNGTNANGQLAQTGSLYSLDGETQSGIIWRRIVNNLPYLLKTKGTGRALKAMMNIYGIPQTLLSIKEYGGPSPSDDRPTVIEDRFAYALNFSGSQYIEMPWGVINPVSASWGGSARVADTVEFRFKTNYSGSVSMSLWAMEVSGNRNLSNNLELVHYSANNNGTASYQGSNAYGFLRYTGLVYSGSTYISSSLTSSYLPFFDNDFWTVNIYSTDNLYASPNSNLYFRAARSSDSLYGRVAHSASFEYYPREVGTGAYLDARVFLRGPFSTVTGLMSDTLRTSGYIPTTEPYTVSGSWHVNSGGETATSASLAINGTGSIVDWIFLELRYKNNPSERLHTRSGLLRADGRVVDVDGSSSLFFASASADDYYVAIRHRNHLSIRSALPISLASGSGSIDFTGGSNSKDPMLLISASIYGMRPGDANQDGVVTTAIDRDLYYTPQSGLTGYRTADFNFDGTVNSVDRNSHLNPHVGQSSSLETGTFGKFWANDAYVLLGGTTASYSSRFVGQIQGYKEYFESLSNDVFYQHVHNPTQYSGNETTSSYKTLYRYYPLGLDAQRWDHSVYTQVSSSQPNRLYSFGTTASFFNFTGSESDQYESVNETYYITPPKLAGNIFRSEKIRLETSQLYKSLSQYGTSEISAYDKAGFDTNRLAVVFAPNDHVNFDISNQFGFADLDDFLGDPEYDFELEYAELTQLRGEYFKKYQRRNDVNALIRLLALYDYTFFEQVKQLVPGRADLITGILLESDFIHRPKALAQRRPKIENLGKNADIPRIAPTWLGESPYYNGSSSITPIITTQYQRITGSFARNVFGTANLAHYSGSLYRTVSGSATLLSGHSGSRNPWNGILDTLPKRYSGSQSPTQSYVDGQRQNCCYQKTIFHYSASGQFATRYEKLWYQAVSMSYGMYYSRSMDCAGYQNNECFDSNNHRFRGSKLYGANININSSQTIDGGPVVSVWEVNPNQLIVGDSPLGGKLTVG